MTRELWTIFFYWMWICEYELSAMVKSGAHKKNITIEYFYDPPSKDCKYRRHFHHQTQISFYGSHFFKYYLFVTRLWKIDWDVMEVRLKIKRLKIIIFELFLLRFILLELCWMKDRWRLICVQFFLRPKMSIHPCISRFTYKKLSKMPWINAIHPKVEWKLRLSFLWKRKLQYEVIMNPFLFYQISTQMNT